MGVRSYLIDDCEGISDEMLAGATKVGVTAGASVPEYIVQDILKVLAQKGGSEVILTGDEQIHRVFPLPDGLDQSQLRKLRKLRLAKLSKANTTNLNTQPIRCRKYGNLWALC